jgi:hypothetical protein
MTTPRHWKPLVEMNHDEFAPYRPEVIETTSKHYGIPREEALALLQRDHVKSRYFVNDLYQVQVATCGREGSMLHLNIRRRDGGMFKDWRHFQEIKNQIAGPECEAVEIYPAESRKVDTTNKWHLWVLPPGVKLDLGWGERDVSYAENRDVPGMRQRPL